MKQSSLPTRESSFSGGVTWHDRPRRHKLSQAGFLRSRARHWQGRGKPSEDVVLGKALLWSDPREKGSGADTTQNGSSPFNQEVSFLYVHLWQASAVGLRGGSLSSQARWLLSSEDGSLEKVQL